MNYLSLPVLSRLMSVDAYGIYTVYTTWINVFAVFIGFQVSGTIPSVKIKYEQGIFLRYMRNAMLFSVIAFFCISCICLLFSAGILGILQLPAAMLPLLLIQSYGNSCASVYSVYTIQTGQAKRNARFSVGVAVFCFFAGLLGALWQKDMPYAGKAIGDCTIYICVIIFVLHYFCKDKELKINADDWKLEMSLGIPMIFHLLAGKVFTSVDKLMLKHYYSYADTAVYGVADTISLIPYLFVQAVTNVFTPIYLDMLKCGESESINESVHEITQLYVVLYCCYMFLAPDIFRKMVPSYYTVDAMCLALLVFGGFINSISIFFIDFERYACNTKIIASVTSITAIANMLLNVPLIRKFDMQGAAVATLICNGMLFCLHRCAVARLADHFPVKVNRLYKSIIPVSIACAASCILTDLAIYRYAFCILIMAAYLWIKRNSFRKLFEAAIHKG